MGRPAKADRSKVVGHPQGIRFTPEELATLKEAATIKGERWQTYMKRAAVAAARRLIARSK